MGVSTPEDEDECAYPGPEPRNLRNARIDDITGNVEFEVENEDAAHVAATVSQLILDDDDIESIISRPMNYSRTMECKVNIFLCEWELQRNILQKTVQALVLHVH